MISRAAAHLLLVRRYDAIRVANASASRMRRSTSGGTSPSLRSSRSPLAMRLPGHLRRSSRGGNAALVVPLRTCFPGSASSAAHRSSVHAARPDHTARGLRPARLRSQTETGEPDFTGLRAHPAGPGTSCSAARERITSSASWSAASITCETSTRTSCEISGFQVLNFVSNFSAMASTTEMVTSTHQETQSATSNLYAWRELWGCRAAAAFS